MSLPTGKTLVRKYNEALAYYPDLTFDGHADMLGIPRRAYHARRNEYLELLQSQPVFSLGEPLKLSGDWMITGDWHIPYVDLEWVTLVLQVAHKQKVPNLLIAGDFINADSFSAYPHLSDKIPDWAQERDMARALFTRFRKLFKKIVVLMGNHERRIQKATLGTFDETDIFALVTTCDSLVTTPFGYCTVGDWRVTHPKNYGINQLTTLDQIALKYQTNVVGFHEHHLSMGWDRYGRYVIVNGGSLVDPDKLAYVTLDDNKAAVMKPGFVMLKNNTPYLFGKEPVTDWDRWLK